MAAGVEQPGMSDTELLQLPREDLLRLVRDLQQVTTEQRALIVRLQEELARLRGGKPPADAPREPPEFVKANRAPREKKPRKPRGRGFARRRETPTKTIEHRPETCSICGRELSEGWVHDTRQIIEIPRVRVQIIEHQFRGARCGVCERREISRPDLSDQVLGKSRLGVRLMSYIAHLDTVCRLPVAMIKQLLAGVYGLHLSEGEIVRVQQRVAEVGQETYEGLLDHVRRSPVVHADETGAREDGVNGYIWCLSTPDTRFYHRDQSRAARVIQRLLGHDPAVFKARSAKQVREVRAQAAAAGEQHGPTFRGTLVSDFYSGYSWYGLSHQRCLVHLDRDLDELKAAHGTDPQVCEWVEKALDMIERAKTYVQQQPPPERVARSRQRRVFEEEAAALGRPYAKSGLPQEKLAKRLLNFCGQLFVFVDHPGTPADNNAAERAIRPFVVMRKVSGGTRSRRGSTTQAVLLSLFGTWMLRGQNPLETCRQMLAGRPTRAPT